MKNGSLFQKGISFLLTLAILVSMVSGCAQNTPAPSITDATIDTQAIVDQILDDLTQDPTEPAIEAQPLVLSTNWEDYVGDMETFVYGLLTHQLEYKYEVFPAAVKLSDGTEVYGLAYTDYSECFTNEDESLAYFSAGMLTFCGEDPIPNEEFEKGLIIENLDYQDEQFGFLLKYATEEFTEHCVAFGQYLKYGANSSGQIIYTTEEYVRGNCDESLGSLYSYDEGRYVLDLDVGEYTPISGVSLASQIDFDLLEEEINRILETQEVNFAQVDIESNLYFAQEAVSSYLLSLQEETFLGYDVDVLIEATNDLDPMECLQMSPEGILTINIDDLPGEGATPLAKWLVGATCVIVTAVGLVGSTVFMMCPALSAASGAVTGAAIDVFMQVVVSGEALSDVDWGKVALAAVTGAVTGFLGPYVQAATNGAGYFLADSAIDALMGGIEYTVAAWMDGESGIEMLKSFGYGFVLGFAMSAAFKGVGALIGKLGKSIGPGIAKAAEKIAPKLTAKACSVFSTVSSFVLTNLTKLQAAANSTPFYSTYIANAMTFRQLARLVDQGMDEMQKKAFNHLPNEGLLDLDGKHLSKEQLKQLFKNAKDGSVLAQFKKGDDVINVIKKNGIVGLSFDQEKFITVDIGRLVDDRDANFVEAAKKLKQQWLDDPGKIPPVIKEGLDNIKATDGTVKHLEDILPEEIVTVIKRTHNSPDGYVLHENIDMKTVTLVSRALHDVIHGGITHVGGFSLAKYVKAHMGSTYFERFLAAASSGIVTGTS